MVRTVEADYLVVGAGAAGMAFTDALIDHADVRVAMVDRRQAAGGHWRDAYPFVRLHQASAFYGVASTLLGGGRLQESGPEAGLHERASVSEICAYYDHILTDRMLGSGKVEFFGGCDYVGDRTFVSQSTGEQFEVPQRCRIVDARFLAPDIPANTPPPFAIADGVRVIPINDLSTMTETPSQYVVVGSGKTSTDAIVWLLTNGVQPDKICWVRPRDPWMLNRAVVQPNPAVFTGMVADTMQAAGASASLEDFFSRLEEAGIMLRIDRSVMPTMAKTPTLAAWELEHLREVEHVVRLGHIRGVEPGQITLEQGTVSDRERCRRRALRGLGPQVPAERSDLGAIGDHRPADPRWIPLLRGRARRLRRGNPRRRCGEEQALPADAAARHHDQLGEDDVPRRSRHEVVRLSAGHQGLG